MLLTSWYFSMVFIILATSFYQWIWLKKNGYKYNKKVNLLQKIGVWMLALTPIVNTFMGLVCGFVLVLYVFNEDLIIEAVEYNEDFIKIK